MSNFVLAKIKGKKNYKLLSLEKIYEDVVTTTSKNEQFSLENTVDDTVKESDVWFYIPDFSNTNYCNSELISIGNSAEYKELNSTSFSEIKYIISCQENLLCFQKVSKSKIIKKKFLSLRNAKVELNTGDILFIKDEPDIIFSKNENRLYFKDISVAATIFTNLKDLYRSATDSEVTNFFGNSFIKISKNYNEQSISIPNRRRIAKYGKIIDSKNENEKAVLFEYIRQYVPEIPIESNQFIVSNDDELKKLLYGIGQRYYTTSIDSEKRVALSIKSISSSQK